MPIDSIIRVELFPSNRPSTNNVYSYRNGNPTLVFSFSENDSQYLMSNTLRLNFGIQLISQAGAFPNNNDQDGTGAGGNIRQNPVVGANSVIESITLSNNINQQLEYVRNYPRLLASILPMTSNFSTFATTLDNQYASTANEDAAGLKQNNRQEVSMPLLCGMFLNGEAIPMGGQNLGTGGLQIKIQLAASIKANYGQAVGGLGAATGSYYEIYNPSISCAMGIVNQGLPKIKMMPYTSFSAYYGVLNNSDETINIPTGLSSVLAQFSNFIPTQNIANSVMDGNATPTLRNGPGYAEADYAPIARYTVLKANLQYPYLFATNEEQNITTTGAGLYTTNYTAQRQRNFLTAMRPADNNKTLLAGNVSEATIAAPPPAGTEAALYGTKNTPGKHVTGVGCRYDLLNAGAGANFSKASFSHRIQSQLNGISPNSIYTFFLHKNMINYTNSGITVAS